MASSRHERCLNWVAPVMRGILPLAGFHVPRRLRKTIRKNPFEIRCDTAFGTVIRACADPRPDHPETWINDDIIDIFERLHRLGYAHSIETWRDSCLVGGLYGLALGGAFFGESMFSHRTDASKIALVHLVARLRLGDFTLLDVQFITDHLQQFGAVEIPNASYLRKLTRAISDEGTFYSAPPAEALESAMSSLLTQSSTQTS